MKRFIGFIKKEIYHILRDRRSLFILFGMPIVQILLFGFAITNEINNVKIGILDKSNDEISRQLIQKIDASPYFQIDQYIYDSNEFETTFKKGKIKAILVFEAQTAKELTTQGSVKIQVLTDATEPNTANTILNYIQAIIQNFQSEINLQQIIPLQIVVESKMLYNPELKSVYLFVPGVMTIILMLVSAMMTSISIAKEKEIGTMEILLVSPLNPSQVIVGKVFPYIILSIFNAIVILLLGFFVFGMPMNGNLVLLGLESVLFILSALSLGILISTISQTQQTAMMISLMGLLLPVILLSGYIFPISSMPQPLQIMSNIVPAKWYIIILKGIMLKASGIALIWKETLILVIMTLFFLALSVKNYKIRLE
jgi:ABC-2 type transport system permease protein